MEINARSPRHNGAERSGKSTLSHIIAGKKAVIPSQKELLTLMVNLFSICSPEERANWGYFLAFQYPVEIPGVNNIYMLREKLEQ